VFRIDIPFEGGFELDVPDTKRVDETQAEFHVSEESVETVHEDDLDFSAFYDFFHAVKGRTAFERSAVPIVYEEMP